MPLRTPPCPGSNPRLRMLPSGSQSPRPSASLALPVPMHGYMGLPRPRPTRDRPRLQSSWSFRIARHLRPRKVSFELVDPRCAGSPHFANTPDSALFLKVGRDIIAVED